MKESYVLSDYFNNKIISPIWFISLTFSHFYETFVSDVAYCVQINKKDIQLWVAGKLFGSQRSALVEIYFYYYYSVSVPVRDEKEWTGDSRPPSSEEQEECGDHVEEQENDPLMSVFLLLEQNEAANLRDAGGKSPVSHPSHKTMAQSFSWSGKKIQENTLTPLDPYNLSPR